MGTVIGWFLALLCIINMLAYLVSMAAPFVGPYAAPYVAPLMKSVEKALPWAKTPEEIAAERAAHDREVAENIQKEATFQKVVLAAQAVKQSVREPKSFKFEDIMANDDATVICMAYQVRNRRGGLTNEMTVHVKGKASRRTAVWDKHCVNSQLNDMRRVANALE
jgi:nucleotide-binding universal stress UspA family protein